MPALPLPLQSYGIQAFSGKAKLRCLRNQNGGTVCEAPLERKTSDRSFSFQAEDGNFCLGEWPKIAARREAKQIVLSFGMAGGNKQLFIAASEDRISSNIKTSFQRRG